MTISVATIQKLSTLGLTTEQMVAVLQLLAVELAPLESIRKGAAERQRHARASRDSHATPSRDSSGTPRVLDNNNLPKKVSKEERTSIPPSPLSSKPLLTEPEGFAEFWQVYPKRDGSADRKGALKAFGPALKRADLQTILDGAEHFAAAMTDRGKIGTEFIPQARTWLNGDRWNERYDAQEQTGLASAVAILEKYRAAPRTGSDG